MTGDSMTPAQASVDAQDLRNEPLGSALKLEEFVVATRLDRRVKHIYICGQRRSRSPPLQY